MLNRHPRRLINQMNVVPYIDVMLVLLVIFMVTTPMFTPGVIEVPSASSAKVVRNDEEPVYLEIQNLNNIRYKDQTKKGLLSNYDLADWANKYANTNRPIVLSADKHMSYNDVIGIVNILHLAKIRRVALVVKQKK